MMCEESRAAFEAAYRKVATVKPDFTRNDGGQYINSGVWRAWCMWCAGYNQAKAEE